MTNDLKDLVPAQEKLEWVTPKMEWVTPKISLMAAEDTDGKTTYKQNENIVRSPSKGPS